jgi:hypothetical protein
VCCCGVVVLFVVGSVLGACVFVSCVLVFFGSSFLLLLVLVVVFFPSLLPLRFVFIVPVLDSLAMMKWDVIEAHLGYNEQGELVATNVIPLLGKSKTTTTKNMNDVEQGSFALLDPVEETSNKEQNGGKDAEEENHHSGEDEEEEISLGSEDGSDNETSEEHGKPIEAAGATLGSGETKENNGGGASLVSAASSAVAAAVAALGSVDSGSSGEKKKEENAVPMGPSAWPGFMAVASEDTLTTETVQIQQYIRWLLTANDPVNVLVVLLEDPRGRVGVVVG